MLEFDPIDQLLILRAREFSYDVTSKAGAGVLAAFVAGADAQWLTAEEPSGLGIRTGLRYAALAPATMAVQAVIGETPQGFALVGRVPTDDMLDLQAAEAPANSASPPMREQFGAVLSNTEGGLLLCGGTLPDDSPAHDLWSYTARTRKWAKLPLHGALPEKVLASTYRYSDRSMFVLDERRVGLLTWTRLLQIDLTTLHSEVVGVWPRHKAMDRVFLSAGPQGELVIVGSSSSKRKYYAVILEERSYGLMPTGGVIRSGVVALKPTLTERGLSVPLQRAIGAENDFVPAKKLRLPFLHGVGDCL